MCRFKEIKILLSFVSRVESDGLKRNHENMKSNDENPFHHGSENEGTCFFFGDSLNKNILRKKVAWLRNEESMYFELF